MRLLFDQNLSPRLVQLLADLFPDSTHVLDAGLAEADDRTVWQFAIDNRCAIVSKDGDFRQLSFLAGAPPKVVLGAYGQLFNGGYRCGVETARERSSRL